jgi:hypothetical protein
VSGSSAPSIRVTQLRRSASLATSMAGTTSSAGEPGRNGTAPIAIGPLVPPRRSSWSIARRNAAASSIATRAATPRPANPTPSRTNK